MGETIHRCQRAEIAWVLRLQGRSVVAGFGARLEGDQRLNLTASEAGPQSLPGRSPLYRRNRPVHFSADSPHFDDHTALPRDCLPHPSLRLAKPGCLVLAPAEPRPSGSVVVLPGGGAAVPAGLPMGTPEPCNDGTTRALVFPHPFSRFPIASSYCSVNCSSIVPVSERTGADFRARTNPVDSGYPS